MNTGGEGIQRFHHRITHHPEAIGCGCHSDMEELSSGEYVLHSDHQAEVKRLEARIEERGCPEAWLCPKCLQPSAGGPGSPDEENRMCDCGVSLARFCPSCSTEPEREEETDDGGSASGVADAKQDRCYRCEHPRSRHASSPPPGPPAAPRKGQTNCCHDFLPVPDKEQVFADLRMERAKAKESRIEANAAFSHLKSIGKAIEGLLNERNAS